MKIPGANSAFLRRIRRRLPLGMGIGAAVGVVIWFLALAGVFDGLENGTFDARARALHDPAEADSSIVIVAIDDNSLEAFRRQLGRWPWPRETQGQIVAYLAHAGARLAIFDITFPEPDSLRARGDSAFALDIASSGRVVLPMTLQPGDSAEAVRWERNLGLEGRRELLERHAIGFAEAAPELEQNPFVEPADPLFLEQAAGVGSILLNTDEDGVTRRSIPAYASQGKLYPNIALAAARVLRPDRYAAAISSLTDDELLLENGTRLPLDDGSLVIQWHGRYLFGGESTYRIVRAADVLLSFNQVSTGQRTPETADVPFDVLRGKVVFIATTGIGTFEPRATPLAQNDPGVMIHAATLDNYLNDGFLERASAAENAAVTILPALLAGLFVAGATSAALGALFTLSLIVMLVVLAGLAYVDGVWLDLAAPLAATSLSFALVMSANYFTEGRERKRVKDLFSRYVSPQYVSQLADHYQTLKLGGERVPLTLLFSDIRGFTSMSERLPPETVISMLNEYLDRMAEVVFRNGGTLDKFIGDAVMAFWGAPIPMADHARRALDTALEMMTELRELNRRWAEQGITEGVDIGIGVNTGEAIVGNIGSLTHKLDYTAIGDAVNLASRLEGLNKNYGTNIIVSEATKAAVGDDYDFRSLDDVKVKGKEQAVQIYELMGRSGTARANERTTSASTAGVLVLAAFGIGLGLFEPTPVAAQTGGKERWVDYVYQPGRWTGGRLVAHRTTNPRTDTLAFTARVDTYVRAPRWRAEIRRMVAGDTLGIPTILVGNGADVVVITGVGSTQLAQHQAAGDTLVQAVVSRFEAGRPLRPDDGRFVDRAAGNRVQRVVLRFPQARADFADALLETGTVRRAAQGLARLGVETLGAGRDQEVVASAGARGVARVQTVDGEIVVDPDTVAVVRMEQRDVNFIELDAFMREGGLGVYARQEGGS
ncbi:MAG TPA: adenylate/guanylate cyclase domain-containing protein [Longimicrobiales bacterium]|nr:adenylate/guanylate cyclase domain-containing protein [Longimicrobiales bacterium]